MIVSLSENKVVLNGRESSDHKEDECPTGQLKATEVRTARSSIRCIRLTRNAIPSPSKCQGSDLNLGTCCFDRARLGRMYQVSQIIWLLRNLHSSNLPSTPETLCLENRRLQSLSKPTFEYNRRSVSASDAFQYKVDPGAGH